MLGAAGLIDQLEVVARHHAPAAGEYVRRVWKHALSDQRLHRRERHTARPAQFAKIREIALDVVDVQRGQLHLSILSSR
jgi:hypothetical protein